MSANENQMKKIIHVRKHSAVFFESQPSQIGKRGKAIVNTAIILGFKSGEFFCDPTMTLVCCKIIAVWLNQPKY